MKTPKFTEWLYGVVMVFTFQLLASLVLVPIYLLNGNRVALPIWSTIGTVVCSLVAVVVVPVIVFRWCRFFVRVASRKMYRQSV